MASLIRNPPSRLLIVAGILTVVGLLCFLIATIVATLLITTTDGKKAPSTAHVAYFQKMVAKINGDESLQWKARFNPWAERVSDFVHEVEGLITHKWTRPDKNWTDSMDIAWDWRKRAENERRHAEKYASLPAPLPDRFDAREKWPQCESLRTVPDQGACGSCWAVTTVYMMSDRICIHSGVQKRPILSARDLISCCRHCGDCAGGSVSSALRYMMEDGIVTEHCKPYDIPTNCGAPCSPSTFNSTYSWTKNACDHACVSSYGKSFKDDKHKASWIYVVPPANRSWEHRYDQERVYASKEEEANAQALFVDQLKRELMIFGPVTAPIAITEELMHYDSGVYSPLPGFYDRILYEHVIRLIGWDSDYNQTNWLAVSSWGTEWGDGGLFRIRSDALRSQEKTTIYAALP